jgi:hypothetical protein
MVKFTIDIASVMDNPHLTISSSPFTNKSIIKRVPYKGAGNAPPWLQSYALKKGSCKGEVGKETYGGKMIPSVAACVAKTHGAGGKKRKSKAKATE